MESSSHERHDIVDVFGFDSRIHTPIEQYGGLCQQYRAGHGHEGGVKLSLGSVFLNTRVDLSCQHVQLIIHMTTHAIAPYILVAELFYVISIVCPLLQKLVIYYS
jgi:hypothetical protein